MDVTMPQLGETVTEGTITKWMKKVGDSVALDEILFEVSTDKVDSEVPSPAAGVISEIVVQEGDEAAVGAVLAKISDGDAAPAPAAETPAPAPEATPAPAAVVADEAPTFAPPVAETPAPVPARGVPTRSNWPTASRSRSTTPRLA